LVKPAEYIRPRWGSGKKAILEEAQTLFEKRRGPKREDDPGEPERLYGEIGRLTMELDWLKKTHHFGGGSGTASDRGGSV